MNWLVKDVGFGGVRFDFSKGYGGEFAGNYVRACRGEAVQVDPIKPKLKPPGTKCVETKVRHTAFNFCFQNQLAPLHRGGELEFAVGEYWAGTYTRPLLSLNPLSG
jgi:hypothetical protein